MTARGDSSPPVSTVASAGRAGAGGAAVSTSLVLTLALQSAVPPFATDMYTPAFPQVTADLATSASLVGLTLTTFFLGMALGQLLGGPLSDQRGRRNHPVHDAAGYLPLARMGPSASSPPQN